MAAPAHSADDAATLAPGQTVRLSLGATEALVTQLPDQGSARLPGSGSGNDRVSVQIVLTLGDGDTLRARVRLAEGQTHMINLTIGEDVARIHRYGFLRQGTLVRVFAVELMEQPRLAHR